MPWLMEEKKKKKKKERERERAQSLVFWTPLQTGEEFVVLRT